MSHPARKLFRGLDHVGLTVPDVEAAVAYYTEVFGARRQYTMGPLDSRDMPPASRGDWTASHINVADARLTFVGMELLPGLNVEIYQFDRADRPRTGAARNCDQGYHHLALRVNDVEAAAAYLLKNGFTACEGPIVPPDGPLLGSRNWYLADPWGNQFELMEYGQMAFMAHPMN